MVKLGVVAGLAAVLTGCAGLDPGSSVNLAAGTPNGQAQFAALAKSQASFQDGFDLSHRAVIELPGAAGHVRSVSGTRAATGFRQEILVAGPASTPDRITLLTSAAQNPALDGALSLKPSESTIKAELAIEFPGSQMDVWPKPLANAYGPYGLASGQSGTAICVYAWQWIDDSAILETLGFPGPAAWRVRLCRPGLDLSRAISWIGQMTAGRVLGLAVRASRIAPKPAVHLAKRARAAIPSYDSASGFGRDLGSPESGPRYLAPIQAGTLEGTQSVPAAANSLPTPGQTLDRTRQDLAIDLPPQATRGPRTPADRVP